MRATLLDLGVGNLHSLAKAIVAAEPSASVSIESDPLVALGRGILILPGVGAFPHAAARLEPFRGELLAALEAGQPCIGICLGMQLLFEESDEGAGDGIGFFGGRVTRIQTARVPHMGWSSLEPASGTPLLPWPSAVYYAHSYGCRPEAANVVLASTTLDGDRVAAAVRRKQTFGLQFHPEKSSRAGIRLLSALLKEVWS